MSKIKIYQEEQNKDFLTILYFFLVLVNKMAKKWNSLVKVCYCEEAHILIDTQFYDRLHLFVYLLCSYGDHVQHFKVLQDRCSQYYVWDEAFSSLNELVDFYHSNSIAKERTVFLRDPEHFARVSFF